ncbi:MAG TPA: oxaloacetate-decarboxylating malate dehydrogenase, partial [Chromatiales bacterium]|nr:oxaloacetate-decarboxylating malate dehydrogenase [Chromatiales bacterium]
MSENHNGKPVRVKLRGHDLIREPLLNKGSGFTHEERLMFDLEGLMPVGTLSIDRQAQRVYRNLAQYEDPLHKFIYLASLQDRNEHLYFRLLGNHLEELMPIVYTPTVGLATQRYSHVFQRGRGVWITPDIRGRIAEVLAGWARDREIRLVVATDNEAILGIGDQGAGGMAISIGKLSLYTAGAGVDPASVLPISLDVGTENERLLHDGLYLGWPHRRLRGDEYESLLDEFVDAIKALFPRALIQWEDFRKDNALRVLDRYATRIPSFNDDIQGTGAMALAGILSAARIHGRALTDERVVILGAGAAGLGIARQIRGALVAAGCSAEDARHAIASMDSRGLIVDDGSVSNEYKRELAWTLPVAAGRQLGGGADLAHVIRTFRPTVLIGTSGQAGVFTEEVIKTMAQHVERPVVMPLSNPTSQSEADPADVIRWTDGRALVAAGSPFPVAHWAGREFHFG